jgi:hypothetical protein
MCTMAVRSFMNKALYGPIVFMCILSIGIVLVSFGYQPVGLIHNRHVEIIGLDAISKIMSIL